MGINFSCSTMGNSNSGNSTTLIILLAVGCCCCLLSSAVPLGFYMWNQQFKDWVNALFNGTSTQPDGNQPEAAYKAALAAYNTAVANKATAAQLLALKNTVGLASQAVLAATQPCPEMYQVRNQATGACEGCPNGQVWRSINNTFGCYAPTPQPGETAKPLTGVCPVGYVKNPANPPPSGKGCMEKAGTAIAYAPAMTVELLTCTNGKGLACPSGYRQRVAHGACFQGGNKTPKPPISVAC